MKTRPILFSGPMMRALLDGRKTQTRRVVKRNGAGRAEFGGKQWHIDDPNAVKACPYGTPGDLLWVRETHGFVSPDEYVRPFDECNIFYRADYQPGEARYGNPGDWPVDEARGDNDCPKWRPSIHMPRWASRLTLQLTDVRVERVQEISEDDVLNEGITHCVFLTEAERILAFTIQKHSCGLGVRSCSGS